MSEYINGWRYEPILYWIGEQIILCYVDCIHKKKGIEVLIVELIRELINRTSKCVDEWISGELNKEVNKTLICIKK